MIADAPVRDYISYSAVRIFQSCPLKYRFRYIDGLPEDSVSASLVFGSAIHSALEFFYEQQLTGAKLPDLDILLDVYQQNWRDRPEGKIQFGKRETADSLHQLADRMLTEFLANGPTHAKSRILGIEEELRGELIPGLPDLLGRVDLLLETDEALVVTDFKTARSAWTQSQADGQAEQLLLYGDLVRPLIPGKQLKLEFMVITKAQSPKLQRLKTRFDEGKLNRTKKVIEAVWDAVQAGSFYPAPSPLQCPVCGYRSQCAAWRGNG